MTLTAFTAAEDAARSRQLRLPPYAAICRTITWKVEGDQFFDEIFAPAAFRSLPSGTGAFFRPSGTSAIAASL